MRQEDGRVPLKKQGGAWPIDPTPEGHAWDIHRSKATLKLSGDVVTKWSAVCECGWSQWTYESRTAAYRAVGWHHREVTK